MGKREGGGGKRDLERGKGKKKGQLDVQKI